MLAGCGSSAGNGRLGASTNTAPVQPEKGGRTLNGCLRLWSGAHPGSTRMKTVAANATIYVKVQIVKNTCRVTFATADGKIYGRYAEKPNVTGAWTQEAETAPKAKAQAVTRSANATGLPDGSIRAGSP
jgi:hypothetical protein